MAYLKIGAAFVLALAFALLAPRLMGGGDGGDLLKFSLASLAGGTLCFFLGFDEFRERLLIRNTPTSSVRSLAVGDVEVEGRARPLEEPLVSPLTHKEACLVEFEIEEEHEDDDGSDWHTVFELREAIDFEVDDGTGQVRVAAGDASLEVEREKRVHVDEGELPPEPVRRWAKDNGYEDVGGDRSLTERLKDGLVQDGDPDEHLTGTSLFDRRYTEKVLAVDEETYVFGAAKPREGVESADNAENLVLSRHEGTGKFILSDKSESELAKDKLVSSGVLLAIAVALIPTGLIGLLRLAGGA